jgi:superfamily I DNA/RNA helicase
MPLVSIPKKIEGMNKSEKYILNKLKQLYLSESHIVYLYLEPKIKNLAPDFILIDPIRGVIILEVKAWSIDFMASVNQKEVLTSTGEILENPLYKARRYFNRLQSVLRKEEVLFDTQGKLKVKLHSVACFPNLKQDEIQKHEIDTLFEHYPARAVYKEELTKLALNDLFSNELQAISPELTQALRIAIFPEIQILKKRTKRPKENNLDNKILALDVEQERFAKSLPLGHYMVTGIPGSGKTVVLLSRAIYLAKLYPHWKILIVTYNKSLTSQLLTKLEAIKLRLDNLEIQVNNIEVTNFHKKAMELSHLSPSNYKNNSDEFWRDILARDAMNHATPSYNAILVDEYQDFYKSWFQLLLKLLIEHQEGDKSYQNFFLAGDRLQGIYNPNEINWKEDIGLDMRGRSKLLKKSYRITKEHITLGLSVLTKGYAKEVEKFYEDGKDIRLENMNIDSIELFEDGYDELVQVFESLLKTYNPEEILLLAPTWKSLNSIKNRVTPTLQPQIVSTKDIVGNKALFMTYHSSKGIEAKIAIIVDFDEIKDNKLLYVALTRASHKLILHTQNFKKSSIKEELSEMLDFTS